jgi:hypothetical protein
MADLDRAVATPLANIEKRTGKLRAELRSIVNGNRSERHGERVAMLKSTFEMGHGDGNLVVHAALTPATRGAGTARSAGQVLDTLYAGPKTAWCPIRNKRVAALRTFGPFEEAPKKTCVSYRRTQRFAMNGLATNTRVVVELNVQGLKAAARLEVLPAGQMSNFKVRLTGPGPVDAELLAGIGPAYDAAGRAVVLGEVRRTLTSGYPISFRR